MKNVADVYHLTPVQRELLQDPHSARVVQVRRKFSGELDSEAFERAWQQLSAGHAILRTCFLTAELKEPVQVVRQQVKLVYERYDLGGIDPEQQRLELEDLLRMDRRREFDPARAPLFRVMEVRLNGSSFEIVLSHYPVLLDEQSVKLIFEEVLDGYREDAPAYRDYVTWVERQDLSGAERYFRNSVVSSTNQNRDTGAVASRALGFSSKQTKSLHRFARSAGVSIETLITGAWALALMRERDCGEISLGISVAGRPRTLPQSQQLAGLFSNVLPLSLSLSEQPLSGWLLNVERKRAKVQRYAHVSREQIRNWVGLTSDAPLFDATIVFHEPSDEIIFTSRAAVESPLCLEVALGDELGLQIHATGSNAERTSIGLIERVEQALGSFMFPLSVEVEPAQIKELDPALEFSLFYFADDNAGYGEDKYRLYREGAIFADRNGLTAVWTPERHFHEKAGLYPNPSVLSAALA
ncbi:MAG TPA: condensation domain-containing protein, partial [Pyrinomonadaceae bacterium]|nr:condensation domain-containing protein [Pyrinomonadaceae bacterium]